MNKKIFAKLLLSLLICLNVGIASAWIFDIGWGSDTQVIYCKSWDNCSIESWVNTVKNGLNNVETEKKFSQKVQDIVKYVIYFVGVIGVLYIIYAGFNILIAGWSDEKVKKSKTTILHVLIWIILMFMAYPIISFIINMVNWWTTPTWFNFPSIVQEATAYTDNDKNTFDEYKKWIELLTSQLERDYRVNSKLSSTNLTELKRLVTEAINTFPENNDYISNNNLGKNLLIAVDVVAKNPESETRITELAKSINDFLTKAKIGRIMAKISANPNSGNAPLTVSLRSEGVVDPSGVPIPSWNYVWWIKNWDGTRTVLGTGPSIVKTFKEEKTYIVNLTIVSASRNQKWKIDTLPFSSSVNINVLPKIWTIYLYINWVNVSDLDRFKITPALGRAGIIIDATASQATGWSSFTKTFWDFGNWVSYSNNLYPRIEKQYFSNEWIYRIKLKLLTNEGKEIAKEMDLEVRDPIASIRVDKLDWFVWDDFKLSTFSVFNTTKLDYEWKIVDLSNDQVVFSSALENISFKFRKTGKFSVRLKSRSASWREDTDTRVITIETRDPVGSFETRQTSSETPNYYLFDGTLSYDPDTFDNSKLKYSWFFDWQKVDLENSQRGWARGYYTFDSLWTHKIVLEVSNQEWKTVSVKKDLQVDSLLSVKLNFVPKIVKIWNPVMFIANSKEAISYEWNFWDDNTNVTNSPKISHTYKKSWTYNVSLTVKWDNNSSNTISRNVYVTYWDSPFALISVKSDNEDYFPTAGGCSGNEAYLIDRSKVITLSGENSINTDGNTAWLDYSWRYMNKNSNQKSFTYKFDELGCFPVSLTVKSQKTWKIHKNTIYIKVENIPPKIPGLTISAANIESDPVVVKVSANNPIDEDWVIVSYLWYYYTDSDPEPQDFRITKSSFTTFVLPKITWKYYFVLIAEDSNWAKVNTDEISEQRYSISLSGDNINTPLITLEVDKTNISTNDEINFKVSAKDILWKDISGKVEYKWDFDWNWFYEQASSSPQISHVYTMPWTFNFKVKATYKWISNTKYQIITVKNVLKPNFEYYAIWGKLVLFNTSKWTYNGALWTLWNGITSSNLDYFVYDFGDDAFPTSVNLKVFDNNESKEIKSDVRRDVVNKLRIKKWKDNLVYFTYPAVEKSTIKIDNIQDKLFIYLGESKWSIAKYCVDTDISIDSDLNGTKDDDCDNKNSESYNKWTPFITSNLEFLKNEKTIRLSIIDEAWKKESKDILLKLSTSNKDETVEMKDNKDIWEQDKIIIEDIKNLIKKAPEGERVKLMQFLSLIQENWFDDREKTKAIIDFESYINATASMDQKLKDEFYNLAENLLVKQDQVKDDIKLAAKVLKSLIPKTIASYDKIMKNIDEILSHPTNTTMNKTLWKEILDFIKNDTTISDKDKLIIKSQLEVIIYWGQANVPQQVVEENKSESGWIMWFLMWFVKLFGYLILWVISLILWLFVYFKVANKNENLSFQDFLIERFLNEKKWETNLIINKVEDRKDDILSSIMSPIEEEKIPEPLPSLHEEAQEIPNEEIPHPNPLPEGEGVESLEEKTPEDNKIPDWLKTMTSQEEIPEVVEVPAIIEEEKIEEEKTEEIIEETKQDEMKQEEETYDWLKWINKEELEQEVNEELSGDTKQEIPEIPEEIPEVVEVPTIIEEKKIEEKKIEEASDELPDWLKWSLVSKKEVVEEEEIKETKEEGEIESRFLPAQEWQNEKKKEKKVSWEHKKPVKERVKEKEKKSEKKEEKIIKIENKKEENKPKKEMPVKDLKSKKEDINIKNDDDLPDWLKS